MATTIRTSTALEAMDGRANAALRISARLELSEILSRVVPAYIALMGEIASLTFATQGFP